eukprot:jgi/Psemu1/15234/gm1.15234_g
MRELVRNTIRLVRIAIYSHTNFIVNVSLLDHISNDASCYSYYTQPLGVVDFASCVFIRKLKKLEDATQQLGLTNTRNGPQSSGGALPEVLDNQVMYDPSVKPIGCALIGWELTNIEDDDDSVSDDNFFFPNNDNEEEGRESTEAHHSLSVNDEVCNGIDVDDSHCDTNMAIMTPNAGRHVSDELMVKIKLMKIMQIITRSRVMREISANVPEIIGNGFEPHLIDWCSKKSTTSDVPISKEIYVWSFQEALHSLLTDITLVKEENLSFPHAEDPTLPVRFPELQGNIDIDELHHGEWWINTWEKRCKRDSNEILVPIILYMDGNAIDNSGQTTLTPLNTTLGIFNTLTRNCRPDAWETVYFHLMGSRDKGKESIDNVSNLPSGLRCALSSLKEACNLMDEYQSVWLWNMSNFTSPTVEEGVNVEQYFKNVSHHRVHNGKAFYDLDFGENPHNMHLASPGERLHMHQLGCVKRATETFSSYYGGAVQRQSDHGFPRTNFSELIHSAKKEGNPYIGMLYIQMLTLLSAEGCQLLLSLRTTTNLENRSRKCEEEIDGRIYALELLLGMEEFLKYAGTFDEVFKEDNKGVLNLDKMVVHFINCINNYLQQSKGEGNNLVKNHMYFHLSQYMRLFGPPTGWDSAASESNHKIMEYRTIDQLDLEFDLFHHKSFTGVSHPTEGGRSAGSKFLISVRDDLPYMKWDEKKNASVPWYPSDVLKFCCDVVLLAAGTNTLCGSTEHKSSVSGFELVHDGYYAVACCFLSVNPILARGLKGKETATHW